MKLEDFIALRDLVRPSGDAYLVRCPCGERHKHGDANPSLLVWQKASGWIGLKCWVGCEQADILHRLGLENRDLGPDRPRRGDGSKVAPPLEEIRRIAREAFARVLDDDMHAADSEVYRFLAARGLADAWSLQVYGILGPRAPGRFAGWYRGGYRLLAPLFDTTKGDLRSFQCRRVLQPADPADTTTKLTVGGTKVTGTVFANPAGRRLLRGQAPDAGAVLYCEGLTDYLAAGTTVPEVPVLAVPGVAGAARSVAGWATGRMVLICFDGDSPGQEGALAAARAVRAAGGTPRRVGLPDGAEDLSDAVRTFGVDEIRDGLLSAIRGEAISR